MSSPYRESGGPLVSCPRCGKGMPHGELAACIAGCGAWLASEAAATLLTPREVMPSRITSWFRDRCACPMCGKQMELRGDDMSLFLGCDTHGFWFDENAIMQTSLAHPMHAPLLAQMRAAASSLREQVAREEAERRLAEEPARREAEAAAKAREEAEERARTAYRQRLQRVEDLVHEAIERRNIQPLVDELMRLDEIIASLAHRLTNAGL